jgi:hypothetical protein
MHLPTYPLSSPGRIGIYEFVSEGDKGRIRKQILFSLAPGLDKGYKNTYNLAFGDVIDDEGGISDISISDNGDRDEILATVVSAVYEFTNQKPDAKIYFRGHAHVFIEWRYPNIIRCYVRIFTFMEN